MAQIIRRPAVAGEAAADDREAARLGQLVAERCRLGDDETARLLLERALDAAIARHGDQAAELLSILDRLGAVYRQLGELKRACKCAERVVKITEAAFGCESFRLAPPLEELAGIYFALGSLDKCYRAAERALAVLRAGLGDGHVEVAVAQDRLGVALAEMGAYERARTLHLQALAVLRPSGRKHAIAAALANAAATYLATGELASARALYEEALATARAAYGDAQEGVAAYLALLGDYWVKAGDDLRALLAYRDALAIRRLAGELRPECAELLFKIGRTEYRRDKTTGRRTLLQAVAVLDVRLHRPHLFADMCSFLAGELAPGAAAILFWKLAINQIESVRLGVARLDSVLERSFLKQKRDDFRALGEALIAFGRLPEAQHVLTMIKEQELFGLARVDARKTKVPLTALEAHWVRRGWRMLWRAHSLLEDERRAQIASGAGALCLGPKIDQAASALDAEFNTLLASFAEAEIEPDREARPAAAPESEARPSNQTPAPGTALLQFMLTTDRRSMNVILTAAGSQREHRAVLADGELNRLVYEMREALQRRSDRYLPSAQRLHDVLLAPFEDILRNAGIKTLAFSLDGVLRYLPIGALHDGRTWLVERYALVLATHAAAAQMRRDAVGRAVGLGVSRPIDGHAPLFGVREELNAVIRTAGRRDGALPGIIRLDGAFTAAALERAFSPQYSVVHIASHFVFAAAREASSYLLLGDGSKFTLAEFADLRFDATDLVVLSACNTAVGGGHHQNGHEIEGLGALVRHRGANQVLATLWPVADMTTSVLMRGFYRNRYRLGLEAPEALRRAQVALLQDAIAIAADDRSRCLVDPDDEAVEARVAPDTRHPFYWAPYILMGALPAAAAPPGQP